MVRSSFTQRLFSTLLLTATRSLLRGLAGGEHATGAPGTRTGAVAAKHSGEGFCNARADGSGKRVAGLFARRVVLQCSYSYSPDYGCPTIAIVYRRTIASSRPCRKRTGRDRPEAGLQERPLCG